MRYSERTGLNRGPLTGCMLQRAQLAGRRRGACSYTAVASSEECSAPLVSFADKLSRCDLAGDRSGKSRSRNVKLMPGAKHRRSVERGIATKGRSFLMPGNGRGLLGDTGTRLQILYMLGRTLHT